MCFQYTVVPYRRIGSVKIQAQKMNEWMNEFVVALLPTSQSNSCLQLAWRSTEFFPAGLRLLLSDGIKPHALHQNASWWLTWRSEGHGHHSSNWIVEVVKAERVALISRGRSCVANASRMQTATAHKLLQKKEAGPLVLINSRYHHRAQTVCSTFAGSADGGNAFFSPPFLSLPAP